MVNSSKANHSEVRKKIDRIVDAQEKNTAMMGVNLINARPVRRRKLSFKEHKVFVWSMVAMGVVAVGLAIAIVVVAVLKNAPKTNEDGAVIVSEATMREMAVKCAEKDALEEIEECLTGITDPLKYAMDGEDSVINVAYGAVVNVLMDKYEAQISNAGDGSGEIDGTESDGSGGTVAVIDGFYGDPDAIETYVVPEDIKIANILVDQMFVLSINGDCCKARTLVNDASVSDVLGPMARVLFYSGAVSMAKNCGYDEEASNWSTKMSEAMEEIE